MALCSSELCKQLNFVQLAKRAKLLKDIGMPLDFMLSSQSTDEICTVVFFFLYVTILTVWILMELLIKILVLFCGQFNMKYLKYV